MVQAYSSNVKFLVTFICHIAIVMIGLKTPCSFAQVQLSDVLPDPRTRLTTPRNGITNLSFENLTREIRRRHITSIEQLLPLLPVELRTNYSLVYNSHSQQPASMRSPRVIMRMGNVLMTITESSSDPNALIIEHAEYDSRQHGWRPGQITFPDPSNRTSPQSVTFDNHPTNCVTCHQEPFRPNWEEYRRWPGIYGSNREFMNDNSQEYAGYNDFLRRANRGIYRFLSPQIVGRLSRFPNEHIIASITRHENGGDMNQRLWEFNRDRIQYQIQRSPRYQQLKYALYAAVRGDCDLESFLPENWRQGRDSLATLAASINQSMRQNRQLNLAEMNPVAGYINILGTAQEEMDFILNHSQATISKLQYVAQYMGLDVNNWSSSRRIGTFGFALPTGEYTPGEALFTSIRQFLERDRDIAELVLATCIQRSGRANCRRGSFELSYGPSCESLQQRSLSVLRDIPVPSSPNVQPDLSGNNVAPAAEEAR